MILLTFVFPLPADGFGQKHKERNVKQPPTFHDQIQQGTRYKMFSVTLHTVSLLFNQGVRCANEFRQISKYVQVITARCRMALHEYFPRDI